MRRRKFITLVGGTIVWPLVARAEQPEHVRHIAVLMNIPEGDSEPQSRIVIFRRSLEDLGWTEGRNRRIDYHWAGGDADRTGTYAVEAVNQTPDVILSHSGPMLWALRQATRRWCSYRSWTQSARVLSRVWRDQVATSPDSLISNRQWAENG